jgi:hypothetical protein
LRTLFWIGVPDRIRRCNAASPTAFTALAVWARPPTASHAAVPGAGERHAGGVAGKVFFCMCVCVCVWERASVRA